MNCNECREEMSGWIDGNIDSQTRKAVGLHLAECQKCLALINEESFWDDVLKSLLDREAPADLRSNILGDLATDKNSFSLDGLGWRKKWKLIIWGATRKGMSWRLLVETVLLVAAIVWLLPLIMKLLT